MKIEELQQQTDKQLQEIYNSEHNVNRRKAEAAYRDICNEIGETNRQIDEYIKNLDYDNAVSLEEKLASLEARKKTLRKAVDNFSAEPVYSHDDIVKICDGIKAEERAYYHAESRKIYKQLEEILILMDDVETYKKEYSDLAAECYKKSPRYDPNAISNPYSGYWGSNYEYVKKHIEDALGSLKPFLK